MPSMLRVSEIFASIQGEGRRTGWPCLFLRLYGCNLACRWCDTKYSIWVPWEQAQKQGAKEMTINEIVKEIGKSGIDYVCITGGEPLLQKRVIKKLLKCLLPHYLVEINTNGSLLIWKEEGVRWVVDYKLPSSGMWGRFLWENLRYLTEKDDIMMVIRNRGDYEVAKEVTKMIQAKSKVVVNFSPCWGVMSKKKLTEWILQDRLNIRLNLQIHKVIWGPKKRGV